MELMKETLTEEKDVKKILEFSLDAGRILLKNGAEIFRVEETMSIIFSHYGIKSYNVFVMSNGIFVTVGNKEEEDCAKVIHVPLSRIHLGRVTAVNNLSRELVAKTITLDDAIERLKEIEVLPVKDNRSRMLAAGIGSGCFSYLLGGSVPDCVASACIAVVLFCMIIWTEKTKLSKIVVNIGGGALITILAGILIHITTVLHMDKMIIGSIMPLIPGVAFINGIRNIADSEFLSGTVRMIDAILAFISIAVGVGCVLGAYHFFTGGYML